jgi:hypothetical protein
VNPITASESLAPRPTAPSTPIQAPIRPAMEPRHPPAKGRSRRRPAFGATGTARRTGCGGSTAATKPLWGSRPPSAGGHRSREARVAPGLHRRRPIASSSRRGGLRSHGGFRLSSDHRHHRLSPHSSARCHHHHYPSSSSRPHCHHHPSSTSRPRHHHRRRRWWSSPAGRPGPQPQGGGNPQSSR